jgi:hypothetical protein
MRKIAKGIWNMDKDIDLIQSEDESGYYFQNFSTGKITKIYTSAYEATKDYSNKKLVWN